MKNVATFEIIGRVARIDAYEKVTRITTASNYNYKDGESGEWRQDTYWNQSVTFNQRPREVAAELQKGDLVKLTGRLRQSSYEKDGQRIYATDLIASSVELVSRRKEAAETEAA